jgi:sulfide:quinone oxidoreductase
MIDAGLTTDIGLLDVNPYTLQHKKFENIFGFGDAIAGETHKNQSAIIKQFPVTQQDIN